MDVGGRIKWARETENMTLSDLAKKCGVTLQSVHKWESGKSRISTERLQSIADALGVSPAWLLGMESTFIKQYTTKESLLKVIEIASQDKLDSLLKLAQLDDDKLKQVCALFYN